MSRLQNLELKFCSSLSALAVRGFGATEQSAPIILAYHRVARPVKSSLQPTWNVTPQNFERQISGLIEAGCQPWSLTQLDEAFQKQLEIPQRVFITTFDDGFASVYSEALPILRRYEVPATVFLATSYIDSGCKFPSDDWSLAGDGQVPPDSWKPLSWKQCQVLADDPLITLGSHTHTHQDFRGRPNDFRDDVAFSLDQLRRLGISSPAFSYPYGIQHLGFCDDALARVLQGFGIRVALSFDPQIIDGRIDPLFWGRFPVRNEDTSSSLLARWNQYYPEIRRRLRAWTPFMRCGVRDAEFPHASSVRLQKNNVEGGF